MQDILRQRSALRSPLRPCKTPARDTFPHGLALIKLWVVNVALATGTRLPLSLASSSPASHGCCFWQFLDNQLSRLLLLCRAEGEDTRCDVHGEELHGDVYAFRNVFFRFSPLVLPALARLVAWTMSQNSEGYFGRWLPRLLTMAWRTEDLSMQTSGQKSQLNATKRKDTLSNPRIHLCGKSKFSCALPDDQLSSSVRPSLEVAGAWFLNTTRGSRHLSMDVHASHLLPRGAAEHRALAGCLDALLLKKRTHPTVRHLDISLSTICKADSSPLSYYNKLEQRRACL